MDKIIPVYDKIIDSLKTNCKSKNITLITAPLAINLVSRKNNESLIYQYTYCYISPTDFWHQDFDWKNETYNDYARRKKIPQKLVRNAFTSYKNIKELIKK